MKTIIGLLLTVLSILVHAGILTVGILFFDWLLVYESTISVFGLYIGAIIVHIFIEGLVSIFNKTLHVQGVEVQKDITGLDNLIIRNLYKLSGGTK